MSHTGYRPFRPDHKLALAFLALLVATILIGSTIMDAGAAVSLVRFEAKWQNDGSILVVWETSSELDSSAYFLFRAEDTRGPWTDYIDFEPAAGNDFMGATYTYVDNEVSQGATYYYRLEEVTNGGASNFYGPITATAAGSSSATATPTVSGTPPATATPTATGKPEQDLPVTATRQYDNTPQPAGSGAALPTQSNTPAPHEAAAASAPTRASAPLVTTPTPVGETAATIAASSAALTITPTPGGEQVQPTLVATGSEIPTLPPAQDTPTPSPTLQRLAAAPAETSQPLLDVSATQPAPAPVTKAPQNNPPRSRLVLFLGGGALAAAAALGALALLIWRWRAG
jgi:hypothetical protein